MRILQIFLVIFSMFLVAKLAYGTEKVERSDEKAHSRVARQFIRPIVPVVPVRPVVVPVRPVVVPLRPVVVPVRPVIIGK